MRKLKELNYNEKLLIIFAVLLIASIILRWPVIKERIVKGWRHYGVELNK
ncbi:MAG: hypothetical protein AB7S50_11600 [Bacteroidales bacterium]